MAELKELVNERKLTKKGSKKEELLACLLEDDRAKIVNSYANVDMQELRDMCNFR